LPACASASSTAQYVINPTYEQRKQSRLDLSSPAAPTAS
jgi:polyribonucleotide nucleotidyltransferase